MLIKYLRDSNAIRQYFNNDDVYNSFINAIGGEKKAASLGIRFGSVGNGYKYVELPKEYNKAIYSFGKAVQEAENTRNPLNAFPNSAKTMFFGYGDKFVRVDSNGEEHHAGLPTGNKEPYIGLIDYVDSLKSKNDAVLDGYRDWETDRKSTRLNSSHSAKSRMPSSA